MNIFEKAARTKLRIETNKGAIQVEDLFDLPLTSATGKLCLNDIARRLDREIKGSEQTDFVGESTPENSADKLAFEIVLHVIEVKKAENARIRDAAKLREQKQRLLEIIDRKQNEQLESKDLETLRAELAALESAA